MALVLDEGEASVLGFVGGARVHDDVHDAVSDLPHLGKDLLALLGFGNPANKQTAVVDAGTNSKEATVPAGRKKSTQSANTSYVFSGPRCSDWLDGNRPFSQQTC